MLSMHSTKWLHASQFFFLNVANGTLGSLTIYIYIFGCMGFELRASGLLGQD
jgi:hypothetical protein